MCTSRSYLSAAAHAQEPVRRGAVPLQGVALPSDTAAALHSTIFKSFSLQLMRKNQYEEALFGA
jgi:hypothetical protein